MNIGLNSRFEINDLGLVLRHVSVTQLSYEHERTCAQFAVPHTYTRARCVVRYSGLIFHCH